MTPETILIPLSEAAALFPVPPCHATLWRWATHGVRGVKLNTLRSGIRLFTTVKSVEDFMSQLADNAR